MSTDSPHLTRLSKLSWAVEESGRQQWDRDREYWAIRCKSSQKKSQTWELNKLWFSYGGGKASSKLGSASSPTFHFFRERHTVQRQVDQHRPEGLSLLRKPQKSLQHWSQGGSRVKARRWSGEVLGNEVRNRERCFQVFPFPVIPSYKQTLGRSQQRLRMRNLRPQVYQHLTLGSLQVLHGISQSLPHWLHTKSRVEADLPQASGR